MVYITIIKNKFSNLKLPVLTDVYMYVCIFIKKNKEYLINAFLCDSYEFKKALQSPMFLLYLFYKKVVHVYVALYCSLAAAQLIKQNTYF